MKNLLIRAHTLFFQTRCPCMLSGPQCRERVTLIRTRKPAHMPTRSPWCPGLKPAVSPSTDHTERTLSPKKSLGSRVWSERLLPRRQVHSMTSGGRRTVRKQRRTSLPRWGLPRLEAESTTREGGCRTAAETQGYPNPGGPCAALLLGAQRPHGQQGGHL